MEIYKKLSAIFLIIFFSCSSSIAFADKVHKNYRQAQISVMTQNLYVGADLLRIVNVSSPQEIPFAAAQTLAVVKDTNFTERAEAIAEQIKIKKPDLIGLQEVSLIRLQTPSDYFIGNPQNAQDVLYDYLQILLDALERRGLHYYAASSIDNFDVELPAITGFDSNGNPQFIDVRLSDRDVILARKNIKTSNPVSANYQVNLILPVANSTIPFTRGYTAVDAKVHGITYRVVNTHLEIKGEGIISAVQALQAQELINVLDNETKPLVLLGDFNSSPTDPINSETGVVPPYLQLSWAGYIDAWLQGENADKPGYTCCQAENLRNQTSLMNQKIDYIFYRNDETTLRKEAKINIETLGDKEEDKTPSGLWPSDHAGVTAQMEFVVRKNRK